MLGSVQKRAIDVFFDVICISLHNSVSGLTPANGSRLRTHVPLLRRPFVADSEPVVRTSRAHLRAVRRLSRLQRQPASRESIQPVSPPCVCWSTIPPRIWSCTVRSSTASPIPTTTTQGEEAIGLARAEHFDAVVLDVLMPGMDGWEVCRRLKEDPATGDIPIVMLTSLDAVDVPARARQLGAAAVLMKPCPVERLMLVLNAAARHRLARIADGDPT